MKLLLFLFAPIFCYSMPMPKSGKWLTVITHYENGVKIDQQKVLNAFERNLPAELKKYGMDKLKTSGITQKGTEVCLDENSLTKQVNNQDDKCKVRIVEDSSTLFRSIISCDNGITTDKHFELKDDRTLIGTVKVLDVKGAEIKKVTSHSTFISVSCASLKPL